MVWSKTRSHVVETRDGCFKYFLNKGHDIGNTLRLRRACPLIKYLWSYYYYYFGNIGDIEPSVDDHITANIAILICSFHPPLVSKRKRAEFQTSNGI